MIRKSILAIIVTYNPDITELEKNIISIKEQVSRLVVFDNNSINKEEIKRICSEKSIEIILSEINVGLGKAYNEVLEKYYKEYCYFTTFDQDTKIPFGVIDRLIDILEENPKIGCIGPNFSRNPEQIDVNGDIIYKKVIIQSCSVFRGELYEKVGAFNEEYFIDSVDFEYCLRILKEGYKVGMYDGINIHHQLGHEKTTAGVKYISHNEIRNYYIARNHIAITKTFWRDFPFFILKKNIFFFLHIAKIFFLERNIEKLHYVMKGILNKKIS